MSSLDFKIRYYSYYGEVGVFINGVKYRYFLDAGFIQKIKKLTKHNPGKALAFLKKVSDRYEKEDDEKEQRKINIEKEQKENSEKQVTIQEVTRR